MMPLSVFRLALAACVTFASSAVAQDYPTRTIRILQGFAPGGNADVISRVLADELSKTFGQPVTVEARQGAGGNLASAEVAKANPDGYSLVLITTGHVMSPALYKGLTFDPIKDFAFLTTVSELPFFIVVNAAKSPYKTIGELIAAAKARPGTITFGTAGVGSGPHLASELFNSAIGAKMVHVPYRGFSAAITGLLTGDVDFAMAPISVIGSNVEAGTFRALAVTSPKPWPAMPNVPTVASVVPSYEVMGWTGLATTGGTPKSIVDKLNNEFRRIIAMPQVEKKLRDFGGEPASSTPEETTEKVRAEIARWTKVVEEANIPRQ